MDIQLLRNYFESDIGTEMKAEPMAENRLAKLPLYLRNGYKLYDATLFDHHLVLAEPAYEYQQDTAQTKKHLELLKLALGQDTALLLNELPYYKRKRFVQAGMNFIVPGKQLFLPQFFIDLKETGGNSIGKKPAQKLLPSTQRLVILHLLNDDDRDNKLIRGSFKDLAGRLGYSAMGITKAAENLRRLELIEVKGTKEKNIQFRLHKEALWEDLVKRDLVINPVRQKIFVEKKPDFVLMEAGETALPHYTDINPSRQKYYALAQKAFYDLKQKGLLVNPNPFEGNYCLEVWKYDPFALLFGFNKAPVVDPLSLYLTLTGASDQRLQIALQEILNRYIYGKRT